MDGFRFEVATVYSFDYNRGFSSMWYLNKAPGTSAIFKRFHQGGWRHSGNRPICLNLMSPHCWRCVHMNEKSWLKLKIEVDQGSRSSARNIWPFFSSFVVYNSCTLSLTNTIYAKFKSKGKKQAFNPDKNPVQILILVIFDDLDDPRHFHVEKIATLVTLPHLMPWCAKLYIFLDQLLVRCVLTSALCWLINI